MRNKKLMIGIVSLSLLALAATSVLAAPLDFILQPFARMDIAGTYARYGFVIDSLIYFVILLGAAEVALRKQFADRSAQGAKAIVIGVGFALAFAIMFWEWRSGFRLASIWPLALVMVFFTFGLAFYNFIKGGACERGVGMLAFAFLFFFFQALVPSLTAWFARHSNQYVRLIWSIMLLVAIVCLVAGVIELLRCLGVGSGSGGGGSGPSGPSPGPGPIPGPGPSPRPEPGPGENPDFSEALSLLSNLINQYETAFNKFKTRCNDVLQTNYEFLNSGGYHGGSKPPVSAEQWQKVTDSLNELSDISNQINNLLSSITSHPKFSLIINKDNTLLVNLSSKYSALIKSMQEFYVNFMDRYRKGKPPTP